MKKLQVEFIHIVSFECVAQSFVGLRKILSKNHMCVLSQTVFILTKETNER